MLDPGAHRNIETKQQKFHLLWQGPNETPEEYFDQLMYQRMISFKKNNLNFEKKILKNEK